MTKKTLLNWDRRTDHVANRLNSLKGINPSSNTDKHFSLIHGWNLISSIVFKFCYKCRWTSKYEIKQQVELFSQTLSIVALINNSLHNIRKTFSKHMSLSRRKNILHNNYLIAWFSNFKMGQNITISPCIVDLD